MMTKISNSKQHQRGAVLAVSLILLLVLTVLGVATMDTSGLELKMASNNRDRQVAFQAAEAALFAGEQIIQTTVYNPSDFQPACAGANCFTATCNNGLCFNGTYIPGDTQRDCTRGAPVDDVWVDAALNVWNNTARHIDLGTSTNPLVNSIPGVTNQPRFIIEFICYTDKGDGDFDNTADPALANSGAQLFRITSLGFGDAGRGRVMLQSVYRKII